MSRSIALLAVLVAMTASGPTGASAQPFRPFDAASPWNLPATDKGVPDAGNPFADQMATTDLTLDIAGIPPDTLYAKPVYFAAVGDPETAAVTLTSAWSPRGDLAWDGQPIPVPDGALPAAGTDGHIAIVSADRQTAWELWRCTQIGPDGITAAVIAQWDLTGNGYSISPPENSARGSGTPLVSTVLRAEEALEGIDHALGMTVPRVSSTYLTPVASHSDGRGPAPIEYGMLFVLRSDFPVAEDAPVGERNVIAALKTYGAYVVDQGSGFNLDADSTHPDLWAESGLHTGILEITPADMRPVALTGVQAVSMFTGYARPQGATPLYAPLVPAYVPCDSPAAQDVHAPPGDAPSCAPPVPASPDLTVGTPDANRKAAASVGFVRMRFCPPVQCATADVTVSAELTDVRNRSDLSDFAGALQLALPTRFTDKYNGARRDEPATVEDYELTVPMPCFPTLDATGSTCSVLTSADTILPGLAPGGARSIWQLGQIQVKAGGAPFAVQGVFVP